MGRITLVTAFGAIIMLLAPLGQAETFPLKRSECWSTSISYSTYCSQSVYLSSRSSLYDNAGKDRFALPGSTLADRRPTRGFMPSDQHIRQTLIRQSQVNYAGQCGCPYSSAQDGSMCGSESAWSRGERGAPLCYDVDVDSTRISNYRLTRP